ncbi:hypothetical protein [Bradyrhizobium tropiciagri]|uniref:hypothetical protein n=1 Tax=Bradyrhizobium tropiciagri TaxID=312253 RepID=UPI002012F8A7|nr:hypothetical protein [Bradyrhizobium tropiciagri]
MPTLLPISLRFAALATAIAVLAPRPSLALDEYLRASSSAPTAIKLCGDVDYRIKTEDCAKAGYDRLIAGIDKAFDGALAKMPANVKPLLKRDQAWFNEMIIDAVNVVFEMDEPELKDAVVETLRRRTAALDDIARSPTRPGVAGNWVNAFGSITLTPAESGAYRLAADLRGDYGGDRRRACKLTAVLKPAADGWLSGIVIADKPADTAKPDKATEPLKPPSLKLRRQGETLRIVGLTGDDDWDGLADCQFMWPAAILRSATRRPPTRPAPRSSSRPSTAPGLKARPTKRSAPTLNWPKMTNG